EALGQGAQRTGGETSMLHGETLLGGMFQSMVHSRPGCGTMAFPCPLRAPAWLWAHGSSPLKLGRRTHTSSSTQRKTNLWRVYQPVAYLRGAQPRHKGEAHGAVKHHRVCRYRGMGTTTHGLRAQGRRRRGGGW